MIWILIYVFIGAAQEVVLGSALQNLDPIGSLFVSFGFAALYFTIVKIWKSMCCPGASDSKFKGRSLGLKALINLATLAAWGGFFLSLKYVEPAIVSMVCFSIGPLLTTVYKIFKGQRSSALVWCGALLVVGLLWFGYVVHSDRSGLILNPIVTSIITSSGLSGYLWAIVSGFGIVGNTLLTKNLMNRGFTSNQVLANRFTLLILVSGVAILSGFAKLPNFNESIGLIVFSVLTIIVPVVILNRGIQQVSSHIVSLILATMPIVTFVMQLLDSRLVPSLPTLVGIGMMTVAVMLGLKAEIPQPITQSV